MEPVVQPIVGAMTTEHLKQSGIDTVDISQKISQIRENATPVDTILRRLPKITANDWVVKFYENPTRSNLIKITTAFDPDTFYSGTTVSDQNYFGAAKMSIGAGAKNVVVGEMLICSSSLGADGNNQVLRVIAKDVANGTIDVVSVNGTKSAANSLVTRAAAIPAGEAMYLFGTAYGEKQAKVQPVQHLPEDADNYCQLHMAQVEETVFEALNSTKEVPVGMLDYMANRLYEYKAKSEHTSMFGVQSKLEDPLAEDGNNIIYTSAGLINFCGYKRMGSGAINKLDKDTLIGIGKDLFADNNGSENRLWVVGGGVMENLMKNADFQKQMDAKNTEIVLGMKLNTIEFGFGRVHVVHHKGLNMIGRGNQMFSLDLSNIVRRVHEKFDMKWRDLDLITSGVSRVNAKVLEECYCLEVRNKNTHGFIEIAA